MQKLDEPRHVHGDGGLYVGGDWVVNCEHLFRKSPHTSACPRSRSRYSAAKADGSYDVIVIGAGCIGSAIARELSKSTASVLILEAADDVTQGATKGNSGIIHAGFDDKPGSVRAKYCWPGNQMFPQLDRELHFGFQLTGSLVVAKNEPEVEALHELLERGHKNGVKDLAIIQRDELRALEPHIDPDAIAALYAPDAGTITPYEYTIALAENAVENGVELRIRREVVSIAPQRTLNGEPAGFSVECRHWEPRLSAQPTGRALQICKKVSRYFVGLLDGLGGSALVKTLLGEPCNASQVHSYTPSPGTTMGGAAVTEVYRANYIVNAAGCTSDKIAAMVGDSSWHVKPRMGEYLLLNKGEGPKARHVLFPAPHPIYGKGVLVQTTLWGNLILGPTARDVMCKNASGDYEVDPYVKSEPVDNIMGYILEKCKRLVPNFDAGAVIHTFAGIRAKNSTGDWIIGPVEGVPGFINAASIDSPGIAASPAIAVDIVRMLAEAGAPVTEKNPMFNPFRSPIYRPKHGYKGLKMNNDIEDAWKCGDPAANVVCKCERVTEAEVIDACRRSLPIDSTQAIRKRTRAGMGHCQGDTCNYGCEQRVAQIIARENKLQYEDVGTRPWPASSLMPKRIFDDADRNHVSSLANASKPFVLRGAA
mmetsp:Transcript_75233/g.125463  ORF Transcript_75233/g.125463 Transcript_75233/m.125463 type:complete len:650 (-) Transcript_75233:397-2346(-)